MNFLIISALVILVMFLVGYAESRREPRWNEKEERPQHKKAA